MKLMQTDHKNFKTIRILSHPFNEGEFYSVTCSAAASKSFWNTFVSSH